MQTSFFDLANRYSRLTIFKDPLERLNAAIDWEIFRPILNKIDIKSRRNKAGRKPTDRILMFKLIILQNLYNIADERLEYLVTDRLSFMRFLGLDLSSKVPDAKTIWTFRESLKTHKLTEPLFEGFKQALLEMGVEVKSGQMIDATFVPTPIQRNTREENAKIKSGEIPDEWHDNPAKLRQKDVDARWTKKGNKNYYGYKNHVNADKNTKLITSYIATTASVHDSQEFDSVLEAPDEGGKEVWADSAYRSEPNETALTESGHKSQIHERAYRKNPLNESQKIINTEKSRVRARVEHVFGTMENEMGGIFIRTIGIARAKVCIGLTNLTYNIKRVETLIRLNVFSFNRVIAS